MKKWGLIYTFLISLPILDLLSSISNRITDSFFSVGMIIKGIAILISIFYVIFFSSSKKRKITFINVIKIIKEIKESSSSKEGCIKYLAKETGLPDKECIEVYNFYIGEPNEK